MFNVHEILDRWRSGGRKEYRLTPLDGMGDERPLPIHPPVVVGRSERADLHLADPWVSRVHCVLAERDGELTVRDLESRHGVFVNDERVPQAILLPGDVLKIGASRFRVEMEES